MPSIRLISWDEPRRERKTQELRDMGLEVVAGAFGPQTLREFKAGLFSAAVIDLDKASMAGRDAAMALRQTRALCKVPIVFTGGLPEKVGRMRALLPEETYTDWTEVGEILKGILTGPMKEVARHSAFDGYAGVPLVQKLGVKAGSTVALVDPPQDFISKLPAIPEGVSFCSPLKEASLILWFVRSETELREKIEGLLPPARNQRIWIIWPKRSSTLRGDLTETIVRKLALSRGLVDYRISSIDADWTGLLFVKRKKEHHSMSESTRH
jgi:CheY-like chemotaxis protein